MSASTVVRMIGERVVVASGLTRWAERRHRRDLCIVAYHNIVPAQIPASGDRSLHLRQGDFRRQLDYLGRRFTVVPLASAFAVPPRSGRPRAVITFDDAYAGAVDLGVEELARHGMPATIFVAPGLLGGQALWWDVVAPFGVDSDQGLTTAMREAALTEQRGQDVLVRDWAKAAGWGVRKLPAPMLTATEDALRSACDRHSGLTLGAHTWSHPNLTRLESASLRDELERPREWLRGRFDRAIDWLAYPYGIASQEVGHAAQSAGYAAAVKVAGGWLSQSHDDAYDVPRVNIPSGLTLSAFALRMSGLIVK